GFVPPTGPIVASFNQAIAPATIRAQLFNEDGTLASVQASATASTNILTVTPVSALVAGQRYNLALHVDAAGPAGVTGTQREVDVTAPIFVQPTGGPTVGIRMGTGAPTLSADKLSFIFSFSEPVGIGFGSVG